MIPAFIFGGLMANEIIKRPSPLSVIGTILIMLDLSVGALFWAWFLFCRERDSFPSDKANLFLYSLISMIFFVSFLSPLRIFELDPEVPIDFNNPFIYLALIFGTIWIGLGLWFWIWFFKTFRDYGITPLRPRSDNQYKEITTSPKVGKLEPIKNDIKTAGDTEILKEIEPSKEIKIFTPQLKLATYREYEFIGGQVRFKVGLVNNTSTPFTNLKITFNIPKALKWILHEPNYEHKGDSILIPKLGANEKTAVSLYLEPINCMESTLNATVSFFDEKDNPQAITMKPKIISIRCPIFFTETDANIARVKKLHKNLNHKDSKIFPIVNPEKSSLIFSSILSELGKFDIKLISKEYFEEERFGEAWYYMITKVKKNQLIAHILLNGENRTLEFEVAGNEEDQITAFLAEIGDRVRNQLVNKKIIPSKELFNDMRIFVLSNKCPYCYEAISEESIQKFLEGETIKCKNCYGRIPSIPIYVRKIKKLEWLYKADE